MTKQPPVPADNQSPFPIQEAPHDGAKPENETVRAVRQMAESKQAAAKERRAAHARQLGLGAAVGVGSAAIVAGLLYWRGNRKDPK